MKIVSELEILNEEVRKEILQEIEIESDAERRKEEHEKRRRVMDDNTREFALRMLKEEFSANTARQMEHRTPNFSLMKKIVSKKARVYKDTPLREPVEDQKEQKKKIDAFVNAVGLDEFMKNVNTDVEAHRNILVKVMPFVDRRASEGLKNPIMKIGLESMNPESWDVIVDPGNPKEPMVVILSFFDSDIDFIQGYRRGDNKIGLVADAPADKGRKTRADAAKKKQYVWWSDNFHFTTNFSGEVIQAVSRVVIQQPTEEELANPWGRLPFVSIVKDQRAGFWSEGGDQLSDNAILLLVLLADLNFTSKMQAFGYGYIIGTDPPKEVTSGPGNFLIMKQKEGEERPEIGFASPNAQLGEQMNLIEQFVQFALTSEGLEPGDVTGKLDSVKSATSGIQEIVKRSEPLTAVEDEQQLYKDKEPEILQVAASQMSVLEEKKQLSEELKDAVGLAEDVDYNLLFERPAPIVTELEKFNEIKAKRESKLFTELMLARLAHPDMKDKEIEKLLAELREEKLANIKDFGIPKKDDDDDPEDPKKDEPDE